METVLTPLDMLAVEGDGLAVVVAIVLMEAVVAFDVLVVSVVIVAVGGDVLAVVEIVLMWAVEAFDVVVVSVVIAAVSGDGLAVVVEIVLMGAVEAFDDVVVSVVIAVSVMYLKYNFWLSLLQIGQNCCFNSFFEHMLLAYDYFFF